MKKYIILLILFCILSYLAPAIADDHPFVIVDLKDGVNYLDLNNVGRNDMVVRSWWENNNAHGYYQYTFHIHKSDDEIRREKTDKQLDYNGQGKLAAWEERNPSNQVNEWLIVAFEHEGGKLTDSFRTTNGADCVLEDIYLLKNRAGKYEVIIAKRPFKESFYEKLKVTFYRYEFVKDDEGLMGYPPNRFVFKDKMTTRKSYCDANEAFEKEYKALLSTAKESSKDINKKQGENTMPYKFAKKGKGKTVVYSGDSSVLIKKDGTIAWRNNNMGNMKCNHGNFAKRHGAIGCDGTFAIFPDAETGRKAQADLLKTQKYQSKSMVKSEVK